MSVESAFGKVAHGFEEVVRALSAIGKKNVKLEIGLGAAHGEARDFHPGALGEHEQRLGALEGRGASMVDPRIPVPDLPFARNPGQSVASGPALGVERFELERRDPAQHAAHDERIAPAAQAGERPPRQVARLEEYDYCCPGKLGFALIYNELYGGRAQPANGGALADDPQSTTTIAALHPAHRFTSFADVPDRAGGEPGDDGDCGDADKPHHGGPHDSTPPVRGWKRALREFLYGMFTYEIVQEVREMRGSLDRLFMLGLFGEMLGIPILPPYYGLRLLPFVAPQIETWKRSVLREREFGTDHEHHLHGV